MQILSTLLALSASALPQDPPRTKDQWSQADLERVTDEIRADIEKLRGMKFKGPVAAKITDKKGFIDYARKREEATDSPERLQRDECVAKLLGLIPSTMDLSKTIESFLESQVGGFYDPGTNTFYLMEGFGGDLARIILSHELTHALDDQNFGLDKLIEGAGGETDAEWAIRALAEGSGTNAMYAWTIQHIGQLDKQALIDSGDLGTAGLEVTPAMIWKPALAAYMRGASFLVHDEGLTRLAQPVKSEELVACFKEPPRSSEQILHPKRYWDEDTRDRPVRVVLDAKALPPGWKEIGQDTLGELFLGLLTLPFADRGGLTAAKDPLAMMSMKYTNKAAEGWGGDRLVLAGKDDARVLYLATVWDTPEDAVEFHAVLAKLVQRDETPAGKLVSGPELERLNWIQGLSAVALAHDASRSAVTLRIEWKTKKGAEGLPAELPWSVAK